MKHESIMKRITIRNINLYAKERQELSKRKSAKSISGNLINGRKKIYKEVTSNFDVNTFFSVSPLQHTGFIHLRYTSFLKYILKNKRNDW